MNTNNLGTLTRKNSQNHKNQTSFKEDEAHQENSNKPELQKSLQNSLENLVAEVPRCINYPILSVSPPHQVQTDSSDSPNPLINSTASLSSSSSSSNTAAIITNDHLKASCSVKKRVWTPVTQTNSLSYSKQNEVSNCPAPSNLPEVNFVKIFY